MAIPLPTIANVYRVAVRWHDSASSLNAVNVMHFQSQTTGGTPAGLNTALLAHGTTTMFTPMVSTCNVISFDIIPLDGSSATTTFPTGGSGNWVGGAGGEGIPQVAFLIKLQTGLRGRNHRGRIFLPFPSEGQVSAGKLVGSDDAGLTSAWTAFQAAMNAATPTAYELGVAAYDRAHNGTGAHFAPATQISGETFTATQRRRQPGRKVSRHRK